jgi:uncharacterized protein (UPF0261 family)
MSKTIAILATLDTKGAETALLRDEVLRFGGQTLVIDIGVMGEPAFAPDISAETVAQAGGTTLAQLRNSANRSTTSEAMIAGVINILQERIGSNELHSLVSMGGTQGTNNAAAIMRDLPYGFPKLIVSTLASGNVASFVGIKDIVMMPSVGDILGLNPLLRHILSNAAGAAYGMALAYDGPDGERHSQKPMIAITNLGVLTQGTMRAIAEFEARGYETIVFHAVGSGGRAMEQMIREGLVAGVFDYALGDIGDAVLGGLRAADEDRLTVAAAHNVPQVVVPGGIDHIGIALDKPNDVPAKFAGHLYSYHNPMILVPRPRRDETHAVVAELAKRLAGAGANTQFLLPTRGVSSYSAAGGALYNADFDTDIRDAVRTLMPPGLTVVEVDASAEDPAFITEAVNRLTSMIEAGQQP